MNIVPCVLFFFQLVYAITEQFNTTNVKGTTFWLQKLIMATQLLMCTSVSTFCFISIRNYVIHSCIYPYEYDNFIFKFLKIAQTITVSLLQCIQRHCVKATFESQLKNYHCYSCSDHDNDYSIITDDCTPDDPCCCNFTVTIINT